MARRGREPSPAGLTQLPFVRFVFDGPWDREGYRAAACTLRPRMLVDWLRLVAPPRTVAQEGAVTCVVRLFGSPGARVPGKPRDLRNLLHEMHLPLPHRWEMVGRALPAVLSMQCEELSVAEASQIGRYPEPSAFRRHCTVLFGTPASTMRIWARGMDVG